MLEQEKKEKNLKLWRIAVTVLMLLPMAEMLFVLPGLPDIIPVHWGVDGSPDRYGSRWELLLPGAIVLFLGILLLRDSFSRQPKGMRTGGLLTLLVFNVIQPVVLYVTVRPESDIMEFYFGKIVCGLISLLLIVAGNYMPKISWEYRLQRKHGFRTRYALSDETVWSRTQRFGGYAYMISGVVGIAAAFVLSDLVCVLVMAAAVLLSSLLIYWYSWVAWKQVKGENYRAQRCRGGKGACRPVQKDCQTEIKILQKMALLLPGDVV